MIPGVGGGGGASPYLMHSQHGLFHALDGVDAGEPPLTDTHCHALLYNLSVLKDKVQQLQPLVGLAVAHDGPVAVPGAAAIIQEIIAAASSMMYAFQHLCVLGTSSVSAVTAAAAQEDAKNGGCTAAGSDEQAAMDHAMQQWQQQQQHHGGGGGGGGGGGDDYGYMPDGKQSAAAAADTIIELDAAELLAKYTHYCQVCGKGFKRDANLRMHMRAHGDEYKSKAALANPNPAAAAAAAAGRDDGNGKQRYHYSCPQEGCRWNRKHARFQPLKSVICVKNHYKRSHCPKMYVCNRCNRKHFSVLSDLRTHEKHCGDRRWLCSCGTAFSRKDKLLGHVALFAGHHPAVPLDAHAHAAAAAARHRNSSAAAAGNAAAGVGIGMSMT